MKSEYFLLAAVFAMLLAVIRLMSFDMAVKIASQIIYIYAGIHIIKWLHWRFFTFYKPKKKKRKRKRRLTSK